MANKPLKSVKFPGLPDTYTVPQFDSASGGMGTAGTIPDSKAVDDAIEELKEDLNEVVEDLEGFPAKTKTITIDSFLQGYRHNQTNATVKNDNAYTTSSGAIDFKKGDVFMHPTDQGISYYFVTTTGAFYKTYVPSPYTLPEDVTLYIDCRKDGITPQTTPACEYITSTVIGPIVSGMNDIETQITEIQKNYPTFEECQKQGDTSVKRGYHVRNGDETSTYDYLCCTGFFECEQGDIFLILNGQSLSRYTANKEFTTMTELSATPLYSGSQRWNMWIADANGYVRFTLFWNVPVMCAVSKINLQTYPYECISLGDSIFGNNQKPNDLSTYIQNVTKVMSANCGFGGTKAAEVNGVYDALAFCNIAKAINDGNWSDIDIDWYTAYGDSVYMVNAYILCHLVDWSKVKIITVAYGTNDWNSNVTLDNNDNKYDVTTYKGALRFGIEKIQSAYPTINIILLSPLYRYWSNSDDYSTVDDDSDTRQVGNKRLTDYVTAMQEVANEYHLPFYDNYNGFGINAMTAPSILRDGTHLNYQYGVSMAGKQIAAEVAERNRLI